ncbi:hypothetical protein D3C76_883870 [compost metagenome]
MRLELRAAGKGQGLPGFRRHLQTAQGTVIGLLRPAQHRRATARAQTLLGRPQGIGAPRLDQRQPAQIHPRRLPRRRVRNKRRPHQHHPLATRGQARQARPQQLQLAAAIGLQQQLGQGRRRPATGRQRRIQQRMPSRLQPSRRCTGPPLPDPTLVQQPVKADHRAHQPRLTRPQNTPSISSSWSGVTTIGA